MKILCPEIKSAPLGKDLLKHGNINNLFLLMAKEQTQLISTSYHVINVR